MNDQEKSFTRDVYEESKQYINLKIELARLQLVEKIAEIGSGGVLFGVFAILALMIFVFLSIILWQFFKDLIGNEILASLAQILVYCIFGFFLYIFRDKLVLKPVSNLIVKTLLKEEYKNRGGDDE